MNGGQGVISKSEIKRKGKVISPGNLLFMHDWPPPTSTLLHFLHCKNEWRGGWKKKNDNILQKCPSDNQEEEIHYYYQADLRRDYWLSLPITLKSWLPRFADSLCVFSASWKYKITVRMLPANWNGWLERQCRRGGRRKILNQVICPFQKTRKEADTRVCL